MRIDRSIRATGWGRTSPLQASGYRLLSILAGLLAAIPALTVDAEPPTLEFFFPPAVQRGETVTVTATGKLDQWPIKVWVNRPGLQIEVTKDKGKLKVTMSQDATGGIYLVRLHNGSGATVLRPLLVGELPQVLEKEPNNKQSEAQQLVASCTVNGKLEKSGDVDQYSIALKKGEQLVAAVQANRILGAPMDAVMQVCDARGFVLAQNDDARHIDPMVIFLAPAEATYTVRIFAFPLTPNSTIGFAGAANFVYRLTATTQPYLDHALPAAAVEGSSPAASLGGWNFPAGQQLPLADISTADPASPEILLVTRPQTENLVVLPAALQGATIAQQSSSRKQPQEISIPALIGGQLESPADQDVFRFSAKKGEAIEFEVVSRSLGYAMDPLMQVLDAEGKVLKEVDDTGKARDCQLSFSAPADGRYDLLIRDLHRDGGPRYVYRIQARRPVADFQLKLASEVFVIKSKAKLEIPIAVTREHGFAEEISITVTGLPPGFSAEAVKSLPKGDSAKAVKLVIQGEGEVFSGQVRVVGTTADGKKSHAAYYQVTNLNWKRIDPWLTVIPE
jgi:hypothetical protein